MQMPNFTMQIAPGLKPSCTVTSDTQTVQKAESVVSDHCAQALIRLTNCRVVSTHGVVMFEAPLALEIMTYLNRDQGVGEFMALRRSGELHDASFRQLIADWCAHANVIDRLFIAI